MQLTNQLKQRLQKKYGPWAIITGASSGIGRELASRLAEAGLHVLLTARSEKALNELATELKQQYQVRVKVVAADLAGPEGLDEVLGASAGLEVGLLVASAGFGTSGAFLNNSLHAEVNMLKVNCQALLELTHHFSQCMVQQGYGGIILMSSMVAFQGVPFSANYAATKAYVQSLAEALHQELKPQGVDVLAAAPGPVHSGFAKRANMQMSQTLTPKQVGLPILKALGRRATVLPGFLTKFLVGSLAFLPRWGKVRVMKMVMGGMTKHQRVE